MKRKLMPKKMVSFSDDTTLTKSHSSNLTQTNVDKPPVYVRKAPLRTLPYHLILLLWIYQCNASIGQYIMTRGKNIMIMNQYIMILGQSIRLLGQYNTELLLLYLIPTQILYEVKQFNNCTVYGHKMVRIKMKNLGLACFACLLLSFPTMLLVMLFGADFSDKLKETWLLSMHLLFLAYPAIYSVFNCDFKVGLWKRYFIFIIIGGWIGCVVIPLDWDREWQNWPIPVVVGGYIGAILGYTFGAYLSN